MEHLSHWSNFSEAQELQLATEAVACICTRKVRTIERNSKVLECVGRAITVSIKICKLHIVARILLLLDFLLTFTLVPNRVWMETEGR